ncbi:MAG: ATP-binding protein [Actinomycetota bacterium]|nr:ATP-binding protein [Actinomycetota bacterium]
MSFPIRVRLTAWYVALLAVILTALGAFLLIRMRSDLVAGIDRSLDSRAAQISLAYQGGGGGEFQDVTDTSLAGLPIGEAAAQILSARGEVLQSSSYDTVAERPMISSPALTHLVKGSLVRQTLVLRPDGESFRVLALPLPGPRHGEVLVVATSLEDANRSLHRLLVLLLVAGPAVLAAAWAGGWWLARKALLPVAKMTKEAAEIGIDRLDERVAVPSPSDELQRLATTLNAMLDRLERGVAEKRRFVANASHELRTPLAVMASEIDVSLRSDQLSPEARGVLESAREEVERMSRMVANLLTLARIDEGKLELLRSSVDLHDVAATVADNMRPLADAKRIRIDVEGDGASVWADRDRLEQVVANLVENAIKYSGRGEAVTVSVWCRAGEAGLTVADTGSGIPPDVLPHVFDRFFRVDSARSRREGGSGLGLAICKEIMEAHSGCMSAQSELKRGSSFSLALPLRSP